MRNDDTIDIVAHSQEQWVNFVKAAYDKLRHMDVHHADDVVKIIDALIDEIVPFNPGSGSGRAKSLILYYGVSFCVNVRPESLKTPRSAGCRIEELSR